MLPKAFRLGGSSWCPIEVFLADVFCDVAYAVAPALRSWPSRFFMPLARLGCCCRVVACWVFLASLLRARPLDGAGRIFLPLGDVTSRKDSLALQDPVLFGSLTLLLGTGVATSPAEPVSPNTHGERVPGLTPGPGVV